jgi:hypothetical protein
MDCLLLFPGLFKNAWVPQTCPEKTIRKRVRSGSCRPQHTDPTAEHVDEHGVLGGKSTQIKII